MFLIEKDGRERAICRECRKLHRARNCPRRESVNWKEIERTADDFYARVEAFWGRRRVVA